MSKPQIGDNSDIEVDYADVQRYLDELAGKQKAIAESMGSLRSRLKEILTNTGWHKSALAQIRTIDAMSETSRADFLRTFEPLFDAMVSKKWRDESTDLLEDPPKNDPAA